MTTSRTQHKHEHEPGDRVWFWDRAARGRAVRTTGTLRRIDRRHAWVTLDHPTPFVTIRVMQASRLRRLAAPDASLN
jgi:hypothetical protein